MSQKQLGERRCGWRNHVRQPCDSCDRFLLVWQDVLPDHLNKKGEKCAGSGQAVKTLTMQDYKLRDRS